MPEKICRSCDGFDGMIGYSEAKSILGDRSGSSGSRRSSSMKTMPVIPTALQRGDVVFFHLLPEPDLHDHLDEPVVGSHPDGLHAAHVHAAVLDGRVLLEALDASLK